MSLTCPSDRKCYICGKKSKHFDLVSTNAFGYSDLDFRPPEMKRSTMCYWAEKCPNCGYVASSISAKAGFKTYIARYLTEPEYITCDGHEFKSELAKMFYQQYMISIQKENSKEAIVAILNAAWSCDDIKGQKKLASMCRKKAIKLIKTEQAVCEYEEDEWEYYQMLLADLYRRTGDFNSVLMLNASTDEYEDEEGNDHRLIHTILSFQKDMSLKKDKGCYTIGDALDAYPLPKYIYCSVAFYGWARTYYYIADDDIYSIGDKVLVPYGMNTFVGEITEIGYYDEDKVPFSLEKTKHIISKYEETPES